MTAKNVGDFHRWKSYDDYQKSFDRLLRDLKAGAWWTAAVDSLPAR